MADTPERMQTPEGKTRLIKHFEKSSIEGHNDAWTDLWDTNNDDMWDRGKPSPALIDLVEKRTDILSPLTADSRRKRVLIPGCGKGYDVVMLALHGFDVIGLEISAKGVSVAKEYASKELDSPQAYNFGKDSESFKSKFDTRASATGSPTTSALGRGSIEFIQADFFQPDSVKENFDIIYDYTFLCALHPSMRTQWASRMADLLVPGGLLVCLEFPLFKEPSLPGPPWPLQGVHWDLLAEGGDGIVYPPKSDQGRETASGAGLFERKWYFKPEVSYESGRGTDMLSVYIKK